jgi:hypothetical protein
MTRIFFSKFIWADWLLDQPLRRCSPEARGLWLDMLALSVRSEPVGVLADGDTALTAIDIARAAGMRKPTAERLIAELERNNVFSRDDRGRIFSRRLVREHRTRQSNKANGARGGNPQLTAKNDAAADNPHKLEVKSQESAVTTHAAAAAPCAAPPASPGAPLIRAAELMGTTLDALHRKYAWSVFGDTFATWVQEGCDPERDIWPTLRAIAAKRQGKIPASPAYFTPAVREARDKHLAGAHAPNHTIGAPYLASSALSPAAFVTAEHWAERVRVFEAHGHWSRRWGPKPGEPGSCAQKTEDGIPGSESAHP